MNLPEHIFNRRSATVKPEWIADLLERLVWLLDDNGSEIHQTMREWIATGDLERVRVALASKRLSFTRPVMR